MSTETSPAEQNEPFSLVSGGPLYQLLVRVGLTQSSMRYLPRRILVCGLVTWLPLVVLTYLAGTLTSGVQIPFLEDLGAHVRLLIGLPTLLGAELIVHRRMRNVVEQFTERGLIAPEDRSRFHELIGSILRWRNSVVVEVSILIFSFTGGYWLWRSYETLSLVTWFYGPGEGGAGLTSAGYWFAFVSLPIARFLLIRWYFRLLLWYVLLWQISRLKLRLNPLHPDRAGGLGFLEHSVTAFAPVLIAQSATLAGVIGTMIWHEGARLPSFQLEILGFVVILMLLVLVPLMFFVFQMLEACLQGEREFGLLATRYVGDFRQKWLENKGPPDETLLGTGDIQSLADLGNSYEVVRKMRLLPFDYGLVVRLAILISLPLLPLTLTMVPLEEIVERFIHLIL